MKEAIQDMMRARSLDNVDHTITEQGVQMRIGEEPTQIFLVCRRNEAMNSRLLA